MGNWKQEPQSLLPTAEPMKDDVLFFAGFYEGEGSACKHGRQSVVVQVPQKDPEVLYRGQIAAQSEPKNSERSPLIQ